MAGDTGVLLPTPRQLLRSRHRPRSISLLDVSSAPRVPALTGDFRRILVRFAMGAAILLVGDTRTSRMGTLFLVSHEFFLSSRNADRAILPLGCNFASELWRRIPRSPGPNSLIGNRPHFHRAGLARQRSIVLQPPVSRFHLRRCRSDHVPASEPARLRCASADDLRPSGSVFDSSGLIGDAHSLCRVSGFPP